MNLEKLYDISFPLSEDKESLYFQGQYEKFEDKVVIRRGDVLELGTYFNSFSIGKWINYTSINKIKVILKLKGTFLVDFYGMNLQDEQEVLRINCENSIERVFKVLDFNDFTLVGIRLTAMSDDAEFLGGSYYGSFDTNREVKLGITICTFKREKYLLPNLDRLKTLTERNPNINVMVVDNGRTLKETQSDELQIIHNPNFGGSGGFTRGLIEQVNQSKNSHVILMDDDIIIELSAIERLYSMLKHLKSEHQTKFFAGAMLRLDEATVQHENTAIWNGMIARSFGKGLNLGDRKNLCKNEKIPENVNRYAGWWFCCIPIDSIKKIGYPLPIFIKGDDVEYSIRNQQSILTVNGIGVWHEAFGKKENPAIKYFSDRNMFLVNHFAFGFGRLTFMITTLLKIVKRLVNRDWDNIRMLEFAIRDLNEGFSGMTSVALDKKFESLKKYPLDKNIIMAIFSIIKLAIAHCVDYDTLDVEYKNFRSNNLADQIFWRQYLNI
ncbi:MAG: glycosyltransferase family 2 protein [Selenomonadaceae bacterium]|nr:glycosyltransferase family 2 protein [Selenomonadaceae bacterium]